MCESSAADAAVGSKEMNDTQQGNKHVARISFEVQIEFEQADLQADNEWFKKNWPIYSQGMGKHVLMSYPVFKWVNFLKWCEANPTTFGTQTLLEITKAASEGDDVSIAPNMVHDPSMVRFSHPFVGNEDELERLKAEGNTLYQQEQYEEAVQKYDMALGGPEGDGNGMGMGISNALLLNRSACRLVLADRAPPGADVGDKTEPGSKLDMYCSAVDDAKSALSGLRMVGSPLALLTKALCRCGRGQLEMCAEKVAKLDRTEQLYRAEGTLNAEELVVCRVHALRIIATGRNGLDEAAMHLGESLELAPDDVTVKKYLKKVQQLQTKLAARGAPPASQAVPEPQPAAFAPDVVFRQGASWMANMVALEIPLKPPHSGEATLPVFLQKQRNTNNLGELQIWIMYSDHLGEPELMAKASTIGIDTEYECSAGGVWGNLSIPAKHGELRSADEFVLAFDFNRHSNDYARGVPAALVAAGVIEEVRTAGRTEYGEPRLVYQAKF